MEAGEEAAGAMLASQEVEEEERRGPGFVPRGRSEGLDPPFRPAFLACCLSSPLSRLISRPDIRVSRKNLAESFAAPLCVSSGGRPAALSVSAAVPPRRCSGHRLYLSFCRVVYMLSPHSQVCLPFVRGKRRITGARRGYF